MGQNIASDKTTSMTKKELSELYKKENSILATAINMAIQNRDSLAKLDYFYQNYRILDYHHDPEVQEYSDEISRRRAAIRIAYFRSCEVVKELLEAAKEPLKLNTF